MREQELRAQGLVPCYLPVTMAESGLRGVPGVATYLPRTIRVVHYYSGTVAEVANRLSRALVRQGGPFRQSKQRRAFLTPVLRACLVNKDLALALLAASELPSPDTLLSMAQDHAQLPDLLVAALDRPRKERVRP